MAFSNTVVERGEYAGGLVFERGTWNGAAVTTGNITASTTAPAMTDIITFSVSSDGDTAVTPAQDVAPNVLKLTFTASDTGKYILIGRGTK